MPPVQAFIVEANEQRPDASRRAAAAGDGRLHPLPITLTAATVVYFGLPMSRGSLVVDSIF